MGKAKEFNSNSENLSKSWAMLVKSYGRTYSRNEQLKIMSCFKDLDFKGEVKCKNPDLKFWILEDNILEIVRDNPTSLPKQIYFGYEICESLRQQNVLSKFELPKRQYLG